MTDLTHGGFSLSGWVDAIAVAAFDRAVGWQSFDLATVPALQWAVMFVVAAAVLLLAAAVFRRLDKSAYPSRLLYDTSRLFGATLALDELLPAIARYLAHLLHATGCVIFLGDAAGREPAPAAVYGIPLEPGHSPDAESDEPSILHTVLQRRTPLVVEDVRDSPFVNSRTVSLCSARSLLGLPLVRRDEALGAVLICESRWQRRFTTGDIARAQAVVQQLAAEIANAQMIRRERRRAAELTVLNRVSAAVATSLDRAEVCRLIVNEVSQAAGYQHVSLYQLDGRTLRLQAVVGHEEVIRELPVERGLLGRSVRIGQPILLPDVRRDSDYIAAVPNVVSEACAPIRFGGEAIGVINVETCTPRVLDADDLKLLVAIAAQIAVSLHNTQLFEQTRRHLEDLKFLYELARATAATLDDAQVMRLVAGGVMRSLGVDACAFSRWDRAAGCVVTLSEYQLAGDQVVVIPDDLGRTYSLDAHPMTRRVLEARSIEQLQVDMPDAPPDEIALLNAWGFASLLFLPLVTHAGVFGLIELYSQDARKFDPDETARGMAAANLAAVALERARLIEQAEQRSREMEALHEIEQAITALDLDRCLQTVAVSACSLVNANLGHVFLAEPDGMRLRAASGLLADRVGSWFLAQGRGLVGWAAEHRRAVNVPDVHADPRYYQSVGTTQSEIAIPLIANDEVIGVLDVQSDKPAAFDEHHVALLGMLSAEAAIAIHNARLFTEISQRNRRMAAMQQAILETGWLGNLEATLDGLTHALVDALGFDQAWIALVDYEEGLLIGAAGAGAGVHEDFSRQVHPLIGPSGEQLPQSIAQNKTIIKDFIAAPPTREIDRSLHRDLGVQSLADTPIPGADRPRGMMSVAYTTPRRVLPEDVEVLEAIARQAAIAIENARLLDQARHQAERERLVRSVNSKISASIEIGTVMQTAVAELGRALSVSRCLIRLGADPGHMPVAYEYHTPDTPPLGTGYAGQLPALAVSFNERRTVVNLERRQIMGQPVFSSLKTPISIRGRTAGILALHQCDRPRHWTPDQIALVEDVSAQLGIAIDNARLYQEATQSLSDLGLLHSIAVDVASARSLPEAVNRVVESVHKAMQNACVTLLLVDPETFDLIVQAEVGYRRRVSDMRIPAGKGVTGWVAQTGRPLLIPDVAADPRYIDLSHEDSIRSELAVPLIAGSEVVGVLNLESVQRDAFDEADLQMLTALGGNLATVIANLRLLDEVRAANARLRELDRLKSQFVANMSHELRTPLNAILGFSEVLVDGLAGDLAAEQHELVTHIHSSGAHLLALINDVLDLSKIQAGKMTLNCQPIELSGVLDDALAVVAPLIDKKRQALDWEVEARLPLLMADGFRLKQILLNLLSNAHKFSPEGSRITIEARRDGEFVRFGVVDRGDGIQPQDHNVVFQEFAQLDGSLARPHEGTGLGLPISSRLVEMHGGRIWVESEGVPGQGAAFYFTIPIAREHGEPPGMPAASPAVRPASGQLRALIATAGRQLCDTLAGLLREEGYQAVQHDTEQGIAQAAGDLRPALIVVDMTLPDGDGFGALRALKSMPSTRDIPIIVVAGADGVPMELSGASLPVLARPPGRDALRAALGAVRPAPRRVVVVDDDPLINELLEAMLHRPEYDVTSVVNDLDALEIVRREQPDVVVLDLMLPRVDGFDVLEQLRAAPATRDVPVIVLTGKTLSDGEWERLKAMAQIVIKKNDLTRERLFDALCSVQCRMPAVAHPAIAEVAS